MAAETLVDLVHHDPRGRRRAVLERSKDGGEGEGGEPGASSRQAAILRANGRRYGAGLTTGGNRRN
jgi:hypothetical protein